MSGEAALVAALRAGDETAFRRLAAALHPALLRLARVHVPSDAVAEEAVQDTWLAVLRGLDRFEGRSSLKTWIFRILMNRARTAGAHERRSGGDEVLPPPDRFLPEEHPTHPGHWAEPPAPWGDDPEQALLRREAMERLWQAVEALPPRQRAVLILRDIEGLTPAEACNILGLSETNHRVLLHRARTRVREALGAYLAGEER